MVGPIGCELSGSGARGYRVSHPCAMPWQKSAVYTIWKWLESRIHGSFSLIVWAIYFSEPGSWIQAEFRTPMNVLSLSFPPPSATRIRICYGETSCGSTSKLCAVNYHLQESFLAQSQQLTSRTAGSVWKPRHTGSACLGNRPQATLRLAGADDC